MRPTSLSVTEGLDLSGTTTLITGATSGIGRECARVLALRGARVVIACRNVEKAERMLTAWRADYGPAMSERCEPRACDTASMASVQGLVDGQKKEGLAIDRLFLNAGVFALPRQITDEGFEYTLAANYLGHFLMLHCLATAGILAGAARIVVTLSESAHKNPFSRADVAMIAKNPPASSAQMFSSPNSKVLLALMMGEFLRRAAHSKLSAITFNAVDPGPTLTDNVNQGSRVQQMLGRTFGPMLFKKVDEGAAPLLWAATSEAAAAMSGRLFTAVGKEARLPAKCVDADVGAIVWTTSELALGLLPLAN